MPTSRQNGFFDHIEETAKRACAIFALHGRYVARNLIVFIILVNLHALVCLETNGPPDPAASISHWGSLGKQAVPLILRGDGTSALEYSTGRYGAGATQARAHVDKCRRLAIAALRSLTSKL